MGSVILHKEVDYRSSPQAYLSLIDCRILQVRFGIILRRLFIKKNTEIERIAKNMRSETAANVRLNTIFSRKYYLPALTDATKAVKIVLA